MPTTSANLQVVEPTRLDPAWDKAREYLLKGRQAAAGLADELERLRGRFLHQGHGGDRRSKDQVSHSGTLDPDEGFQAAVERELGLAKTTAYRYLNFAKAVRLCDEIEHAPKGETIDLAEGTYEITDDVRKKAQALRSALIAGDTPMNRALPAIAGMFSVPGGGTGGKAATNHSQNIYAGLQKLRTSLMPSRWRRGEFTAKADWEEAVVMWRTLLEQIPDELRQVTIDWAKQSSAKR